MSETYRHMLIPTSAKFVAAAADVQAFLAAMIAAGAVAGEPAIVLWTPSTRTREVRNAYTGEVVDVIRMKDRTAIEDVSRVTEAIGARADYEVETSGYGRPRNPPLPLSFSDSYHLAVRCRQSSLPCYTSSLRRDTDGKLVYAPYGKACDKPSDRGFFRDPHTGEVIEVPDAGCARFWVAIELGKFVVPSFDRGYLKVLHQHIVAEAERAFKTSFVQGCDWT